MFSFAFAELILHRVLTSSTAPPLIATQPSFIHRWVSKPWLSRRPIDLRSVLLLLLIFGVCCVLLLPLAGLISFALSSISAVDASNGNTLSHLFQTIIPRYLLNTLGLVATVLITVMLLGVGCAWITATCRFPGHGFLSWALVLPLAVPSFVMAYAYTDLLDTSGPVQAAFRSATGLAIGGYWFPQIRSVAGAGLMLGFALYPYVYLVARHAFEERNASAIEAAQTLGLTSSQIWWQVTWPMARPAIAAGASLVLMESLADFGAVSYFSVETFTTGIYRAWLSMGDKASAVRLALMLLAFVAALVWWEQRERKAIRTYSRSTRKVPPRQLHGANAALAALICAVPLCAGFVLPVVVLLKVAQHAWVGFDPRMGLWIQNGLVLASVSATLIMGLAILLSYGNRLLQSQFAGFASAIAQSGYAMPGLVVAVGLMAAISVIDQGLERLGSSWFLSGSVLALVFAYAVRFIAVGFQSIDAALHRISPAMDYCARSLGRNVWGVWVEVHWPLIRRAVLAGFLLVFVDCFKELQTTLVLRPFNFDTLVVVAYQFASDERLAEAAVPSLVIVAISVIPVLLLWRSEAKNSELSRNGR